MSHLPRGPQGRLRTTYQFLTRPLELLFRCADTYGDVFNMPMYNGDVVIAGSAASVQDVMTAPPETFVPYAVKSIAPLLGEHSLLVLSGERHRRERKLLTPPFHGDRMRAYAAIMADTAARRFAEAARAPRAVAQEITQAISLDVIIRAVFGVEEPHRTRAFARAVVAMGDAVTPALAFLPLLQRELGGFGPYARFRRRVEALEALFRDQIERARAAPGDDILSLLVSARYDDGSVMSDRAIFDQLRTLLFAGHETTALALAWALDHVHRHPGVLARLRDEIDALGPEPDPERLAALPYLDAVCKEALRLYPIATEVPRLVARPFRLGEHELQPGTGVAPCILLVHHRPELYPEPSRFRPERFLERKFSPFEYLPFGGGNRRCIGAAFAMFEMKIVLGVALSAWQFQLLDQRPPRPVRRNVTLGPAGGVPVALRARDSGALRAA
ncbi:cytochrome P450 [Sorangium cellulosum]|uniref:Cytochrome P450 n=1 Tax=Sorangium cellulosum TaxID=56 RepID=A0A150Q2I5_SORCE|nr:cytochrome P450 [Sorangium cellulosum]KYF62227.1 cytochrome P450 [Sorangium cellulosum]